jgi:putative photosynthetic complex assembly protein 2
VLDYLYPGLYAAFLWWFSTGAIFYLNSRAPQSFRWSLLGGTAVLLAALYGIWASAGAESVVGAYIAFTCGLLAWGWQTMTYYMGYITGPRRERCPPGCSGWRHFLHGVETCVYHELAILASAILIAGLTWGQPNQLALWTFLALWGMHVSAKLNVFLGVRNLNEEFLPRHMDYLKGFLRQRPINLLFPFSVTVGTIVTVLVAEAAASPGASAFTVASLTLLATLLGLAVLEHWFMVLPLPFGALWKWSLAESDETGGAGSGRDLAGAPAQAAGSVVRAGESPESRHESGGLRRARSVRA